MSYFKKIIAHLFANKQTAQKSTDKGYINKNKQKNLGKTKLDGNHYNQKFYKMQCTLCNTEYFANGSDIWLKKCPFCQNGANSSTIEAEFIREFRDSPIGTELTGKEIKSRIHQHFGRNESSVIPSDYCYNRLNSGINYETHLHLFEYLSNGKYKYLGPNYPYTGKIYHKPKSGLEVCVGELKNGKFVDRNTTSNPDLPILRNPTKDDLSHNIVHKTTREVSLSLRYKVLKRDNFKCQVCGASPATNPTVELHIDHILPWSKGGETTIDNLQTLCSKCNLGKSDIL